MYKLCKTEQSAARQRHLELGLLEMMQTVPYDQISITDLCNRLQIPRKAFYRYFTDKEGALYSLIDHTLMQFETFSHPSSAEKRTLVSDLEKFFLFWKSQKLLLDALSRSKISYLLIRRAIQQTVSDGSVYGRFMASDPETIQPRIIQFALWGMLSMVLQWHRDGFTESPKDLANLAARLLTQPLFSPGDLS
ncbi:MAG: TetR/AcrR family transcriptional regulator [Oscillospiraceae bacterium]|nr:TetR/AcrR family transcriptional regulator [Oscillospiraceae bacterium]